MANESLRILAQWFQNLGLLLRQNVFIPENFQWIKDLYVSFLNLEIGGLPLLSHFEQLKRYSEIDVRLQFLLFNAVIPLVITVCTLVLFRPLAVILWYLTLLGGCAATILGAAILILENTGGREVGLLGILSSVQIGSVSLSLGLILLLAGILVVFFFGTGALIAWIIRCVQARRAQKREREERRKTQNLERLNSFLVTEAVFDGVTDATDSQPSSPHAPHPSPKPSSPPHVEQISIGIASGRVTINVHGPSPPQETKEVTPVSSASLAMVVEDVNTPIPGEFSPTTLQLSQLSVIPEIHSPADIDPRTPTLASVSTAPGPATPSGGGQGQTTLKRLTNAQHHLDEMRQKRAERLRCCSFTRSLRMICYGSILIIVGLIIAQVLKTGYFHGCTSMCCNPLDCFLQSGSTVLLPVGIVLIAFGSLTFVYMFLLFLPCCRRVEYKCGVVLERYALMIVFTLLGILLTPMITSIFSSFVCTQVVCGSGTALPVRYSEISVNSLLRSSVAGLSGSDNVCLDCAEAFHPACNCSASLVNQICPGESVVALVADASVRCFSDMAPFYWPPALVMGLVLVIGLPVFYTYLTRIASSATMAMDVGFLIDQNVPLWIRDPKKAEKMAEKEREVRRKDVEKGGVLKRNFKRFHPSEYMFYFPPKDNEEEEEQQQQQQLELVECATVGGEGTIIGIVQQQQQQQPKGKQIQFPPDPPFEPPELANGLPSGLSILYGDGAIPSRLLKRYEGRKLAEKWRIRTLVSTNPIKSLYDVFQHRWRYFRLVIVIVQIVLVFCATVLVSYPKVSVPMTLATHLITSVLYLLTNPYIFFLEDLLNIVVGVSSLLSSVFLVLSVFSVTVPTWVAYIIVALNSVIPILGCVSTFYSFCVRTKDQKKYTQLVKDLEKLQSEEKINANKQVDYKSKQKTISDIDEMVTLSGMKAVLIFFLVLGIISFLSLCQGVLGLFFGAVRPKYVPSNSAWSSTSATFSVEDQNAVDFLGYANWTDMMESCCCAEASHVELNLLHQEYLDVEVWTCANGKRKEKVRAVTMSDHILNGTVFRPFCGREFKGNWQLVGPCEGESTKTPCETLHYVEGGNEGDLEFATEDEFNYLVKYLW